MGKPRYSESIKRGALLGRQTYSRWNSGITMRPDR